MMSSKSVMSSRAVSPAAVCGRPRAARAAAAPAAPAFLSGSRLRSPHLMGTAQGAAPKRQVVRMGLFGLGLPEIAVVAGVAAVLFGPSKLPELGKGLGKTVKSFQTAAKEFETELKTELEDGEEPPKKEQATLPPQGKEEPSQKE